MNVFKITIIIILILILLLLLELLIHKLSFNAGELLSGGYDLNELLNTSNENIDLIADELTTIFNTLVYSDDTTITGYIVPYGNIIVGDVHGSFLQLLTPLILGQFIRNVKIEKDKTNNKYNISYIIIKPEYRFSTAKVIYLGDIPARNYSCLDFDFYRVLFDVKSHYINDIIFCVGNWDLIYYYKVRYEKSTTFEKNEFTNASLFIPYLKQKNNEITGEELCKQICNKIDDYGNLIYYSKETNSIFSHTIIDKYLAMLILLLNEDGNIHGKHGEIIKIQLLSNMAASCGVNLLIKLGDKIIGKHDGLTFKEAVHTINSYGNGDIIIDENCITDDNVQTVVDSINNFYHKYINDLNNEGNAKPNGTISGVDTFFFSFCYDVNYEDEDYLYCNSSKIKYFVGHEVASLYFSKWNVHNNVENIHKIDMEKSRYKIQKNLYRCDSSCITISENTYKYPLAELNNESKTEFENNKFDTDESVIDVDGEHISKNTSCEFTTLFLQQSCDTVGMIRIATNNIEGLKNIY